LDLGLLLGSAGQSQGAAFGDLLSAHVSVVSPARSAVLRNVRELAADRAP